MLLLNEAGGSRGRPGGWFARFRAWLSPRQQRPAHSLPRFRGAAKEGPEPTRPIDKLGLIQRVWGEGFVLPGGSDYLMTLANPIAIDSSMSLLDLTAGLGGPARHVAKRFDVYVTALERLPDLAERGQLMSVAAGLGRRVPVRGYDVETVEFRPRSFDGTWAQFLTCTVTDKERLFREIHRGLKTHGQLAFSELMLREGDPGDPRVAGLRHPRNGPMQLWRMSQYVDCLSNVGFMCRAMEDQTAVFRAHVLRGWQEALKDDEWRERPRRELVALFEEAELWFHLLSAMEAGLIGVTRLHAVVK